MAFSLKRTSTKQNFPFPDDGMTVFETTPCLIWNATDYSGDFRVCIKRASGETVLDASTAKNYIYPEEPLSAGEYVWNVTDALGDERGWQRFFISDGAVTFVRPTAKEVLDGVPENTRPRHLFTKDDAANSSVLCQPTISVSANPVIIPPSCPMIIGTARVMMLR